MTEKDLYEYIKRDREVKRKLAEYKELGARMASPKSCNLTSIPGGNGDDDAFMVIMDTRTKLLSEIRECEALRYIAKSRLDRVSNELFDNLDIQIFDYIFRDGLEISDVARKISYSESSIYKRRKGILAVANNIPK